MSKKILIQIIPESSGKLKTFKIPVWLLNLLKVFSVVFILFFIFALYKSIDVVKNLLVFEQLKKQNEELLYKQAKYEEYFSTLDSVFLTDFQIQNVLHVFLEKDSAKINEFIENSSLKFQRDLKNEIDFEGRYGWIPLSEKLMAEKIPDVIPVIGVISKKFSEENKHLGIDFAAKQSDPVYASATGKILSVENLSDLGLTVTIDHQNGYISTYSHLNKSYVRKNETVKKGKIIGEIGSSGKTSGPHLHFSITKNNKPVNPEMFFEFRK